MKNKSLITLVVVLVLLGPLLVSAVAFGSLFVSCTQCSKPQEQTKEVAPSVTVPSDSVQNEPMDHSEHMNHEDMHDKPAGSDEASANN